MQYLRLFNVSLYMFKPSSLLAICTFILFGGCVKNNENPSWLEVNEWTLLQNVELSGAEGELNHNFSDAWVYIDDEIVGVFELPFRIPILKSGPVNIKLFPAVRNNGISATKKAYPFVDFYEVNLSLNQNETSTIEPSTKYNAVTNFWIEDFEDPLNVKLDIDANTSALVSTPASNVDLQPFNGNFYGLIELNSNDSTWVVSTRDQLYIPKNREAYLELDYYNTNTLLTGVIWISPSSVINNPNIQLNAQNDTEVVWKKIYIDLKELIGNSPNGSNILQSLIARLDAGKENTQIRIDNIKVVYFN